MTVVTWTLRKGEDRRIRSQHPWVFSNELNASPKGIVPGTPIELRDFKGELVARGYGNPHSLIAFRALSFGGSQSESPWQISSLQDKLLQAWERRRVSGCRYSYRLCFSEVDGLPGLIVDYFTLKTSSSLAQVFSVQVLTSGMSSLVGDVQEFFKGVTEEAQRRGLSEFDWNHTGVVLRNDVQIRKLEGLEVESPRPLKEIENFSLNEAPLVLEGQNGEGLILKADLIQGQKTGFFLDQWANIQIVKNVLRRSFAQPANLPKQKVRILDLCCYVGHWGTQLADLCRELNLECEVVLFDTSKNALQFADANVKANSSCQVTPVQGDVLEHLMQFTDNSFDIVIADPPAFIKNKKDLPVGKHAYLKMNSQAFRIAKSGGWVVSCSCSGLLPETDFSEVLAKSAWRGKKKATVVARGGHGPDHPILHSFPEGNYLKMFLQTVE